MMLSSRFRSANILRSDRPLNDDQIMRYAPSIFATEAHESRSDRYAYIATSEVLNGLRDNGFHPFMVCQTRVRNLDKREHTKHMIRLRHAGQINGTEAKEIILLNSHDGSSSYQMLAGVFRFVCHNGLVCGDTVADIRIPHKGDVTERVIEGAFEVLDQFDNVENHMDAMKSVTLNALEKRIFADAALALRYDEKDGPAPIAASQLLEARRFEDRKDDLWTTFNRVQENIIRGGLSARTKQGKSTRTRAVTGMDKDTSLNRALWILSERMNELKAA
ncbi:DUF945 domain-containing protein [Salmonella enterica]|uniref:DUF932 domain-containing protein n=1 Tax=Escherichia coli TaxID=562 RepID=UPI00126D5851|nr:DUF932 domain-containing protein [Escherichia coli]EAQ2009393.1 DUF945 domain-containing protein [Salmonella enterica]ECG5972995.1 DUF945 domain-containing protein [Salmonella enterica subsp. enterica serovar Newport]EDA6128219.1 DUF945 domain-containing protein [Salmonella enterica subsp. enterica serovar Enteritidis]EGS5357178.1 DUF945 domain-containing protein [Salmonella enterica]EHY7371159.1 DUF945 domain-containing protein [Salmonella enterica]